jgi:hypothetical protein
MSHGIPAGPEPSRLLSGYPLANRGRIIHANPLRFLVQGVLSKGGGEIDKIRIKNGPSK